MSPCHRILAATALTAGLSSIALAAAAADQTPSDDAVVRLPDLVISATRTPQEPQFITSSIGLLPLPELQQAQVGDLRTALAMLPGVNIVNTGAPGGQTSIFIRGAASTQTLFVVDGISMSSRSAGYNNFLGSADLLGIDRVEVLRGPQSTLWGSSAMGGVVFIDSTRGCGATQGSAAASFGSFGTYSASAAVSGGGRHVGYSASLGRFQTDNDHPHNGAESWSLSTRIEGTLADGLLLGGTFRGLQSASDLYVFGSADTEADNYLGTLYAQWTQSRDFTSRLTLGEHQRRYTYRDTGAYPYTTQIRDRRQVADWQNTWSGWRAAELVAGATYERDYHRADARAASGDNAAGYFSATVHPSKEATLNAGVRYDHFDTFGSAWTWRAGSAWNPLPATKLHASVGTGFTAPSHEDREGNPAWGMLPNFNLRPEKSTGWDVGLDQSFFGGDLTASVTLFQTFYRDRLTYVSDPVTWVGQMRNINRSRSEGVEAAVAFAPAKGLSVRIAYTFLEAWDKTSNTRLARQPRHTVDAELTAAPLDGWRVGVGLRAVADREESGSRNLEDYTTLRLFSSYEIARNLLAKVRVENALDEKYQEAARFDALPLGVHGGLEYKF